MYADVVIKYKTSKNTGLISIDCFISLVHLSGDILTKVSAGISSPSGPANEVANIHPRRPRVQKRRGCARDVRHNRRKDRGHRVRILKQILLICSLFRCKVKQFLFNDLDIFKYINRDQGQVLKLLSGGDFFGEIGILSLSEGQNR